MRKISIIGDINEDSFKLFTDEIALLEEDSLDDITIELHSDGGNPFVGLAFSSRIRTSPCKITIEAHGLVGSSAVLILAAGDKRKMAKESWLMVHEADDKVKGNTTHLEHQAKIARMLENQWNMLLEFYTKTPKEKWDELHKKHLYIPSDECKNLGIVDEVF